MTVRDAKVQRGKMAHHAGASAEERIADDYARRGYAIAEQRWRGTAGEIDLIFRDGAALIFVEVKKSSSFDRAAARISAKQLRRLTQSAEEFAGNEPMGLMTDVRFDVALVDAQGCVKVIENAFAGL